MPAASLEVQALSAGYGNTKVIDNISLKVEQGKTAAIFGRNGVGKTTLLATLMGHTRRYAGTIKLDGLDVAALDTPLRARHGLGYVPQTRDIFGSLTVEENLRAGLKNRPAGAIAEAYGLFPRLFERRKLPGGSLSGGEQQMLSVARTLLGKPRVLLLDEPLEGLAPVICDELMTSLQALAADGSMTILLVEQQIERALGFAQDVFILERGRLVWTGTAGQLRSSSTIVEKYLGAGIH
jgi:branched-chain amino acid transport system ATP-binding protein